MTSIFGTLIGVMQYDIDGIVVGISTIGSGFYKHITRFPRLNPASYSGPAILVSWLKFCGISLTSANS